MKISNHNAPSCHTVNSYTAVYILVTVLDKCIRFKSWAAHNGFGFEMIYFTMSPCSLGSLWTEEENSTAFITSLLPNLLSDTSQHQSTLPPRERNPENLGRGQINRKKKGKRGGGSMRSIRKKSPCYQ